MRSYVMIIVCALTLSACSKVVQEEIPGKEDDVELGLSSDTVRFDGSAGTVSVPVSATVWSLSNVRIGDVDFRLPAGVGGAGYTENYGWFTVGCKDHEVVLSVVENSGNERSFLLELEEDGEKTEIPCIQSESEYLDEYRDEALDGPWVDVIQPSEDNLSVVWEGGEVRVSTVQYWWINEIWLEDVGYFSMLEELQMCADENYFDKEIDWLRVQRDGNDVVLTLAPNTSGEIRRFRIVLGSGDYYAWLYGVQAYYWDWDTVE